MRHIKDDAYLFSTANINRGEIIASRASCGIVSRGRYIFDVLGIGEEDIEFFNRISKYGSENTVLLSGEGDGARAVMILRFFSYTTATCLAIVPRISPVAVRELFSDGETDALRFSPAFLRYTDGCRASAGAMREAQLYLSEIIACLVPLYALKLQYSVPCVEQFSTAVEGVARFIGVNLDYDVIGECCEDFSRDRSDNVYLGPLVLAQLFAWAMEARDASRDRTLSVRMICDSISHRILFSYAPMSEDVPESLSFLLEVAQSRSARASLVQNEGVLCGELLPLCCDLGLSEVKNHGELSRRTDLEIALYNYKV